MVNRDISKTDNLGLHMINNEDDNNTFRRPKLAQPASMRGSSPDLFGVMGQAMHNIQQENIIEASKMIEYNTTT